MELLGRELGTHWVGFGNGEPHPNRTMPWSGRRLLSTRLLTRAQWYHWPGHDAWSVGNAPCVFVEFSRGNDYWANTGTKISTAL